MGWGGYRNEPAVRPADSAGRTSARRFGRPISAGRTAARRCRPNFRPKSSAAVSAGRFRPAGPPPGGSAGRVGRPNRRRVFRPRTAAEPHRRFIPMSCPPSSPPPPPGCIGRGGGTPPSRAPSLCPATVSLTPSASFNGIYNRQGPPPTAFVNLLQPPA